MFWVLPCKLLDAIVLHCGTLKHDLQSPNHNFRGVLRPCMHFHDWSINSAYAVMDRIWKFVTWYLHSFLSQECLASQSCFYVHTPRIARTSTTETYDASIELRAIELLTSSRKVSNWIPDTHNECHLTTCFEFGLHTYARVHLVQLLDRINLLLTGNSGWKFCRSILLGRYTSLHHK